MVVVQDPLFCLTSAPAQLLPHPPAQLLLPVPPAPSSSPSSSRTLFISFFLPQLRTLASSRGPVVSRPSFSPSLPAVPAILRIPSPPFSNRRPDTSSPYSPIEAVLFPNSGRALPIDAGPARRQSGRLISPFLNLRMEAKGGAPPLPVLIFHLLAPYFAAGRF